jgi:hypothetical protein
MCAVSLIIGIAAAAACALFESPNYAAVIAGAVGISAGPYAMAYAGRIGVGRKNLNYALSGVGSALSAIAFVLGIATLA